MASAPFGRVTTHDLAGQREALLRLAQLASRDSIDPRVINVARRLTAECANRDDTCELTAIYEAVKSGSGTVPELRRGVRYLADPRRMDFFTSPRRILEQCATGACAEDCDGHAALIAALVAAAGFKAGLRAYGPPGSFHGQGDPADVAVHVYAVACVPKRGRQLPDGKAGWTNEDVVGLDTTVAEAYVGWQPPPGQVVTAWLP